MKLTDLFEAHFDHKKYDTVTGWSEDFGPHLGIDIDSWMDADQLSALWGLAKDGKRIKLKSFNVSDPKEHRERHAKDIQRIADHACKQEELHGCYVFNQHEGAGQTHVVYVQK